MLLLGTLLALASLIALRGSWGYLFLVIPLAVGLIYSATSSAKEPISGDAETPNRAAGRRLWLKLLDAAIVLLLVAFLAAARDTVYVRAVIWYVLAVALGGLLAGKALALPTDGRIQNGITQLEIIAFGLIISYTSLFAFPSIVGIDPWFHYKFTELIVAQGHIPELGVYTDFPLMQTLVAISQVLLRIDFKTALFTVVSLPLTVILSLATYSIAKYLTSSRMAHLAALFAVSLQYSIWAGFWVIPTSMALGLGALVLVILVKYLRLRPAPATAIMLLFFVALALTHILAALMFWILLVMAGVIRWPLLSKLTHGRQIASAALAFTVGMIIAAKWVYSSGMFSFSLDALLFGFRLDRLAGNLPTNPLPQNQLGILLNGLSFSVVYSLCLVAGFRLMRAKGQKRNTPFFLATMSLVLVTNLAVLAQLNALIPDRWFVFMVPGLAVWAAYGLRPLVASSRRRHASAALALVIVMLFVAVNVTWSRADGAGASLFNPQEIRYGLYESEIAFTSTFPIELKHSVTDDFANLYFVYYLNSTGRQPQESATITPSLLSSIPLPSQGFVVLRYQYLQSSPIYTYSGILFPSRDIVGEYEASTFDRLYDSGTTAIHYDGK